MTERLTKKRFGNDVDVVGDLSLSKAPTADSHAANKLYVDTQLAIIPEATNEPMGIAVRSDSTISFNSTSRIFTIEPTSSSFDVWCTGTRYVKTSPESVTLPTTDGLYYITYDNTGALQYSNTYYDLENETPVAYVYWNNTDSTAYFFADERHGITLDWQTHEYLHRTRGAAYADGLNIGSYSIVGDGTSNTHLQFDLSNGSFFDEDIEVSITHSATPTPNTWEQVLQSGAEIPIFYKDGTLWKHTTPTKYPIKQGTLPQYNLDTAGSWSQVDLGSGTYGLTWVVATNNLNYPVIGIMGQDQYANLNKVHEDEWTDLNLEGLPIYELRPLYKIAYLVDSAFTNAPKAAIREVIDIRRYDSIISGIPATPVSDHGGLLGLSDDDHTQYVHNSVNRTITASHTFSSGLVSTANVDTTGLIVNSVQIDTSNAATDQALIFDGTKFAPGDVAGGVAVSNTAPSSPSEGDLWFDSTDASTYVYYDSSWVAVGPAIPDQIGEIIESKGDIIVADTPSTATRLPVGTNGYYLKANSSTATGLEWGQVDLSTISNSAISYAILTSPEENWDTSSSVLDGTATVNTLTSAARWHNSGSTYIWGVNVRGDGTNTLNSLLNVGDSISVTVVSNDSTRGSPYAPSSFSIDGTSVTPKWLNGSSPSATANSVNVYMYTIYKVSTSPSYVVLATSSNFS